MALDPRHLGKPSCFDGTQERSYDEWRFQLVAYLTAVDPRFGDVADDVARRTTSKMATGRECQVSTSWCSHIVWCCPSSCDEARRLIFRKNHRRTSPQALDPGGISECSKTQEKNGLRRNSDARWKNDVCSTSCVRVTTVGVPWKIETDWNVRKGVEGVDSLGGFRAIECTTVYVDLLHENGPRTLLDRCRDAIPSANLLLSF